MNIPHNHVNEIMSAINIYVSKNIAPHINIKNSDYIQCKNDQSITIRYYDTIVKHVFVIKPHHVDISPRFQVRPGTFAYGNCTSFDYQLGIDHPEYFDKLTSLILNPYPAIFKHLSGNELIEQDKIEQIAMCYMAFDFFSMALSCSDLKSKYLSFIKKLL